MVPAGRLVPGTLASLVSTGPMTAPLIGIGGTLAFFYLWFIGWTSLFPVRDPRLIESLRLTN